MEPTIHLADDSWIDAPPELVAAAVADASRWPGWWPTLELRVARDRGVKGIQWQVRGRYRGSAEIWLEPMTGGVVLHHFLRLEVAEPAGSAMSRRAVRAATRRFAWHAKRVFWQLKDELEGPNRGYPPPRR